jgi:hypothetical protein
MKTDVPHRYLVILYLSQYLSNEQDSRSIETHCQHISEHFSISIMSIRPLFQEIWTSNAKWRTIVGKG